MLRSAICHSYGDFGIAFARQIDSGRSGGRNCRSAQPDCEQEIEFFGTHRFHEEFAQAVDLINSGSIDVGPMFTATYALEDALAAFETADDRTRSVNAQLAF